MTMRDAHQDLRHHARRGRRSPRRDAGADAIGLVFWRGTPRVVDARAGARDRRRAAAVRDRSSGCSSIPRADEVRAVLDAVPLDVAAVPRHEPPALCRAFGRPYLKAIAVKDGVDLLESRVAVRRRRGLAVRRAAAQAICRAAPGRAFDWSRLAAASAAARR